MSTFCFPQFQTPPTIKLLYSDHKVAPWQQPVSPFHTYIYNLLQTSCLGRCTPSSVGPAHYVFSAITCRQFPSSPFRFFFPKLTGSLQRTFAHSIRALYLFFNDVLCRIQNKHIPIIELRMGEGISLSAQLSDCPACK